MRRFSDALAVIAIAGIVVLVVVIDRAPPPPSVARGAAIDPASVAYKHPVRPQGAEDAAAEIAALEARTGQPSASFADFGDLASAYLRRARAAGNLEDYARAEAAARRSLALLASPNGATLVLANIAAARHQFRDAIALAKEHAKGGSADARVVLASAHLAVGELAAAVEAAELAVADRPSTATYVMRALVMQAQGRDAEAGFDFSRAVAVEAFGDPAESARARALWARLRLRRGDAAGALVLLDAAQKIIPDYPLAIALRGEAALRTGDARRARALFEQAFVASRELRYFMDQVRATEIAGDAAGAEALRAQVEKLVRRELAQHGFGHQLDLVELLVDRGRPADLAEAIELGKQEVARRPSAETRFQLARAFAAAGLLADAQVEVRAALALGTRDARLYELAGQVESALGNPPRGALYAGEARRLDPGNGAWRTHGIRVRKEPPS